MTDRPKKDSDPIPIVGRTQTLKEDENPMAAPRREYRLLQLWAADVKLSWSTLCERAGVHRSTAYRIDAGTASMKVLRRMRDVLAEVTKESGAGATNLAELANEWADIGVDLATDDPRALTLALDHVRNVRDVVRACRAPREWMELGQELATLDPVTLASAIEHVRRLCEGARAMQQLRAMRDPKNDDE